MDMKEVYLLIEKFENSTLSELNLEIGGMKLEVKKGGTTSNNTTGKSLPESERSESLKSAADEYEKESTKSAAVEKVITAPLVGTFYRAPGPGEAPFVEVGQQVKKGDVVAIVEAMKLMNEITAEEDGVVTSIEVEDESLVEYGEVLIRLS